MFMNFSTNSSCVNSHIIRNRVVEVTISKKSLFVNIKHLGNDESYNKAIKPIIAENVNGVEIASGDEINRIYFNPGGSRFEVSGVASDGEKVVIREKDGEIISWALAHGRKLRYNREELLNEENAGNFA